MELSISAAERIFLAVTGRYVENKSSGDGGMKVR